MRYILKRIFVEGIKHGREIALASIGQDGHDGFAFILRTFCQLGCGESGSTR